MQGWLSPGVCDHVAAESQLVPSGEAGEDGTRRREEGKASSSRKRASRPRRRGVEVPRPPGGREAGHRGRQRALVGQAAACLTAVGTGRGGRQVAPAWPSQALPRHSPRGAGASRPPVSSASVARCVGVEHAYANMSFLQPEGGLEISWAHPFF